MDEPGLYGRCLRCEAKLDYVREAPEEDVSATSSGISVPVESHIYKCPNGHGLFRVYVSGAVRPYVESR